MFLLQKLECGAKCLRTRRLGSHLEWLLGPWGVRGNLFISEVFPFVSMFGSSGK
jgi:hypothetical protein